jgi:hypothetical protein
MNVYRGTAMLDADGGAWIDLPAYFSEINVDETYQLTPIGGAMPMLHVEQTVNQSVSDNRFRVGGGTAGLRVSWTVTARRNDAYVRTRGFVTESDKPAAWRGKYLHPEVFGRTREEGIFFRASSRLVSPASPLVVLDPGMTPASLEVSE